MPRQWRELATAAGHADYKMANLQYGNLAKRLYQAMGYSKPKSPRSGNEYWILGLGEFTGRRELGLEMQCVMWTEIAEALERLGISKLRGGQTVSQVMRRVMRRWRRTLRT